MNVAEAQAAMERGWRPAECIERSPRLRKAIELIGSGFFSPDDPKRFNAVIHDLWNVDTFMVTADFDAYLACQEQVAQTYRDPALWARMVVHNLARVGQFSSDRTITEYANEIWNVHPVVVAMRDKGS